MKVLVLTSEPVSAEQLQAALGDKVDPQDAELMVVAPALQKDALHFWLSDADQAIAQADQVRRETVESLGDEGIAVSSDTGESDPLDAIADALLTFDADRIVLFTHPEAEQRYREDIDLGELQERFGLPVDRASTGSATD